MLLDSGCTHSVLPGRLVERLPEGTVGHIVPKVAVGRLADGATVIIEGEVTLTFRIGNQWIQHTFLVAPIDNCILLGIDFFQRYHCVLDFSTLSLQVGDIEVSCCDRDGAPLVCKVILPKALTIPPESEVLAHAWLAKAVDKVGVIESAHNVNNLHVACCLISHDKQNVPVRLMNTGLKSLTLPAGVTVGRFTAADTCVGDDELQPGSATQSVTVDSDQPELQPDPAIQSVTVDSDLPELPTFLDEHFQRWTADFSDSDKVKVHTLLAQYSSVFSSGEFDVGRTDVIRHKIPLLEGASPVKQRPYRHGHVQEAEIERQVEKLKSHDLIEECHGAWSSPVVPVRKRDGSWRLCVDYRKVNDLTKKDAYPLPRIDDSLDALGGSQIFSTLDLVSGYWQVELDEEAKETSAFVTRSGLWAWKVMAFGLTSAPATFERLMEKTMRGLHWKTLLIYLDDVIVFAKDMDTHLQRLGEVLKRLQQAGLKLKPSKCNLFADRVDYLGHVVSREGVSTDPRKVDAVSAWPTPRHQKDVRALLGTTGYYRRFIPGYTERAKPLTNLISPNVRFEWTAECDSAFDDLKSALTTAPVLAYPDYTQPFIVDTDASNVGTGAVLGQVQDGEERVIAYYSKSLSKEEQNYCATRKELLAIIKAIKHYRPHIWGRKFTVRTDHASLIWLLKSSQPKGQVARWLETLADFEFEVVHRPGAKHNNADGLSRQLCDECCKQCRNHFSPEKEAEVDLRALQQQSDVAVKQRADVHIGPIYQALQQHTKLGELQCKERSWETKRLRDMAEHLQLRDDGVMVARIPVKGRRRELVICPGSMRSDLVLTTHHQAHLGQNKTVSRIMLQWYWPGLTASVRRLVNACQVCQQCKPRKSKSVRTDNHLYAGRPWQVVGVDLAGPFPTTARGNTQILVVADHFTRWVDAIPIKDGTAETVAKVLEERVFAYLGVPEELHSDQGRQFESRVMEECCRLWGCSKSRTAPYRPQGNSVVERLNRTVGNALRSLLLHKDQHDWDLLLPQIMRALRATPHTVTGETANYLMMGRETRLPDQLIITHCPEDFTSTTEYAKNLQSRLSDVGERLRAQQSESRQEQSDEPPLYLKGDLVWLRSYYRKKGVNPKLTAKYVGPYIIMETLPYHTYRVEKDGKSSIQHEARIRLHVEANSRQRPAPNASETLPMVVPRLTPRPPTTTQLSVENPATAHSANSHDVPSIVTPTAPIDGIVSSVHDSPATASQPSAVESHPGSKPAPPKILLRRSPRIAAKVEGQVH